MANEVVPETTWGPRSLGLADARTVQVQMKYATEQLHYPVWGMSPSSTPDDTGNYAGYGVEGLTFPYYGAGANASHPNQGLSQCHGCATEDVVTPYASFLALDVAPQQAYANIQALRALYPGSYGANGFFDAVNPVTGAVGHRKLGTAAQINRSRDFSIRRLNCGRAVAAAIECENSRRGGIVNDRIGLLSGRDVRDRLQSLQIEYRDR